MQLQKGKLTELRLDEKKSLCAPASVLNALRISACSDVSSIAKARNNSLCCERPLITRVSERGWFRIGEGRQCCWKQRHSSLLRLLSCLSIVSNDGNGAGTKTRQNRRRPKKTSNWLHMLTTIHIPNNSNLTAGLRGVVKL